MTIETLDLVIVAGDSVAIVLSVDGHDVTVQHTATGDVETVSDEEVRHFGF